MTSGTQSPTLGVPIAMAYVAPADAEPGTIVDVEIRGSGPAERRAAAVLRASSPLQPVRTRARDGGRSTGRDEPDGPSDLRYTKDHEWVRVDGDEATSASPSTPPSQLGDIVFVELPDAGAALDAVRDRSAWSSRSRP